MLREPPTGVGSALQGTSTNSNSYSPEPTLQAISDFLDDNEGLIAKINGEVAKWLATPEAKEKLASQGAIAASGLTPEDFQKHIASETTKWAKVVKESGARAD